MNDQHDECSQIFIELKTILENNFSSDENHLIIRKNAFLDCLKENIFLKIGRGYSFIELKDENILNKLYFNKKKFQELLMTANLNPFICRIDSQIIDEITNKIEKFVEIQNSKQQNKLS